MLRRQVPYGLCVLPIGKRPGQYSGLGGILAIAGAAWALSDIPTVSGTYMGVTVTISHGFGLYLTLVGGILALTGIVGLSLKGEEEEEDVE